MYCTPQEIRELLGIEIHDAPDNVLIPFIEKAQEYVKKFIQVQVYDEKMQGWKGFPPNNTFTVQNPYLADTNNDLKVDINDVTCYWWPTDDPFKKEKKTPSTLDPLRGIIVFPESFPADYEKATCDYAYYVTAINWDLVKMACIYYASILWVQSELLLAPEAGGIGALRYRGVRPWQYLREEFNRTVELLVVRPMDRVVYEKMVMRPRQPIPPKERTTVIEEMKYVTKYIKPDIT